MESSLREIEVNLEKGLRIGFKKEVSDDEYLGWILIRKFKFNPKLLALLHPNEDAIQYKFQSQNRDKPYMVSILELNRLVHEAGGYETNEDYRLRENHRFETIEEVEEFVKGLGFDVTQAIDSRKLDAP